MKQRADGRWEKTKRINGKTIHFYSSEPTQRKAERDIERQIISYSQKRSETAQSKLLFSSVADEWQGIKREEIAEVTWVKSYHYFQLCVCPRACTGEFCFKRSVTFRAAQNSA